MEGSALREGYNEADKEEERVEDYSPQTEDPEGVGHGFGWLSASRDVRLVEEIETYQIEGK